MEKLSDEERTLFKELKAKIEANRESVANHFRPLIEAKGWEPMFDSFEDYCKAVYGCDAEITRAMLIITGLSL